MKLAQQISGGKFIVGDNTLSINEAWDHIARSTKEETIEALGITEAEHKAFKKLVYKKLSLPSWAIQKKDLL
jgi:hypothetical protein